MGDSIAPVEISIAARPNNLDSLPGLLRDITLGVNALMSGGPADREDLLTKCRFLLRALETPRETMVNHLWAQIGSISAITFGVDCGLWKLMTENGDKPQKMKDLALTLGIDPALLQTGEDEYFPTNYSKALSLPGIGHAYLALIPEMSAAPFKFHEYCRERGWKNPTDSKDTPLMYAYNTKKDVFAWLREVNHDGHFNDYIGFYGFGRLPWMDPAVYPVQDRLIAGADNDPRKPFLVDVGANRGLDMIRFTKYFPNCPGRLIVQDLPEVVSQITWMYSSIEIMGHDFFTEQPVKGARAYLLHSCLHNWPTSDCEIMLSQIMKAMTPGYSRLLICELIIPDTEAYWQETGMDMIMMTVCASEERTTKGWRELLEHKKHKMGLKILKIWRAPAKKTEGLIECELA